MLVEQANGSAHSIAQSTDFFKRKRAFQDFVKLALLVKFVGTCGTQLQVSFQVLLHLLVQFP